LAATLNRQADWLQAIIAEDAASPYTWRRQRAFLLQGFITGGDFNQAEAWPDRQIGTSIEHLKHRAARARFLDSAAHHWWRTYLAAEDVESAYAAWVLFLQATDRRAWAWLGAGSHTANDRGSLFEAKMRHAEINKDEIERAMAKREDKLDRKFLDCDIVNGVGPWGIQESDD
jgi:hypothetical protein